MEDALRETTFNCLVKFDFGCDELLLEEDVWRPWNTVLYFYI